jgi:hypothetical protein
MFDKISEEEKEEAVHYLIEALSHVQLNSRKILK